MEPTNTQIPHIKAASIVAISLNLAQINALYSTFQVITDLLGKERIDTLKFKFESKQPIDSTEMALIFLSQLLDQVHKSAQEHDQIEYRSLDESLKQAMPH